MLFTHVANRYVLWPHRKSRYLGAIKWRLPIAARDFDLNLLAPLDALLKLRSVTLAAKELGLAQPTVSGILTRLREQLGDMLLVRVGNQMELTNFAEKLAPEVHQILLRIDEMRRPSTEFNPARMARHFRIMLSEFGLCLILPQVFRRVLELAPYTTLEATPIHQPAASVYIGAADLCVTGDNIGEISGEMASQIRTRKIITERLVGIVDAAHPLADKVTSDQLAAYPQVTPQFPGSRWTVAEISNNALSGRCPPRLRIGGFLAVGRLVAGTRAVGLIPSRIASAMAEFGGAFRLLELPDEFGPIEVRLLWHVRHDHDPEHRWLRALVLEAGRRLG